DAVAYNSPRQTHLPALRKEQPALSLQEVKKKREIRLVWKAGVGLRALLFPMVITGFSVVHQPVQDIGLATFVFPNVNCQLLRFRSFLQELKLLLLAYLAILHVWQNTPI